MHRGFTKRWRKRWDVGFHKDHLLWCMMDYFIDHANWEDRKVFMNGQEVSLKRGQHIFGTESLAAFFGVGRQQIRARLALMEKVNFLTIKPTNKYSIVTICNYDLYQSEQPAGQPTNQPIPNQHPTTPKELKKLKKKENSENFSELKNRYSDPSLIDQAITAIASTRKSNRVSDRILLSQLEKWSRYPVKQVEAGIRTYLQKGYAEQGKREEYLLGIIRNNGNGSNHHTETTVEPPEVFDFSRQFHEE